jgi:hypothetical protein
VADALLVLPEFQQPIAPEMLVDLTDRSGGITSGIPTTPPLLGLSNLFSIGTVVYYSSQVPQVSSLAQARARLPGSLRILFTPTPQARLFKRTSWRSGSSNQRTYVFLSHATLKARFQSGAVTKKTYGPVRHLIFLTDLLERCLGDE